MASAPARHMPSWGAIASSTSSNAAGACVRAPYLRRHVARSRRRFMAQADDEQEGWVKCAPAGHRPPRVHASRASPVGARQPADPWPAASPQRPSNRQLAAHRPPSSPLRLSRELFERAALDPEVARVLEGTSGDPELITRNMERVMSDTYDRIISPDPTGEDRPMQVR